MNKKLKATLLSGMVCMTLASAGVPLTAYAATDAVDYGIVLVDTQHKNVKLYSKAELGSLAGIALTPGSVVDVYNALTSADVWQQAGYSQAHAAKIAARIKTNRSEAQGILKSIAYNERLGMKVIIETNYWRTDAYLGKESIEQGNIGGNTGNGNSGGNNTGSNEGDAGVVAGEVKQFQLQIEYARKGIELEYNSAKPSKAKYSNELTRENLKGAAAAAMYEKCIEGVDFSAPDQDIAEAILANINANAGYKQFELEVEFTDGNEVEFELKK